MNTENSFTTKEEIEIETILLEALRIEDPSEQDAHVRMRCADNQRLLERLLKDLSESREGERASVRPAIKAGEVFGNYEIVERIAQGGFATIYRAKHKVSGTFAAIKVFDKRITEDEIDIIWSKETKSLSTLNHDHIPKFYDLGFVEKENRRLPYVILELVQGQNLDEHCSLEDSIVEVLRLFRKLGGVIEYIHDKQIIHLDLTPSNVIVTSRRPAEIKLIDFGSSKLLRSGQRRLTRNDYFFPVSVKYASPEQCRRESTHFESDIYSLGAILYLLLTGFPPFCNGNAEAIRKDVSNRDLSPTLPSKRVLEIEGDKKFGLAKTDVSTILSGDLEAIVMKCLQKRRRARYEKVSDLNRDLDKFLQGKSLLARRETFGYRQWRSLTWLFGLKGWRSGWAKWRSPVTRFLILVVLLPLLLLLGTQIYSYLTHYRPITKRIVNPTDAIPLRALNKDGEVITSRHDDYYYVYCREGTAEQICFTFLVVLATDPAQPFLMGRREKESYDGDHQSKENRDKEHKAAEPIHPVNIKKFYMTRFEITNRQWNIVAKSKKIRKELDVTNDNSALPKVNISYADAREFCERLTRDLNYETAGGMIVRLPSEAEWEYACRADTTNRYGGSDKFVDEFTNAIPKGGDDWLELLIRKIRIGALSDSYFVGNRWGFTAMSGNVWEMVSDSWHPQYVLGDQLAPNDGSSWEEIDLNADNTNKEYVLRGGAFNRSEDLSQCSYRTDGRFVSPGNDLTGFRIVLETKGLK